MTRIDFYFNASSKLEVALKLAYKAVHAGNCMLILTRENPAPIELDAYFWSAQQKSFLPHVLCENTLAVKTPVLIGDNPGKLMRPDVLINLSNETPAWFSRFERLLEVVTSDFEDKVFARNRFRFYKERGYSLNVHDMQELK